MSVHPTSIIRSVATAGTIIASLAFAGVASANDPTVTQVSGNPSCAAVNKSYFEVKIEPVRQGTTSFGNGKLSGSITVKGAYFDWSATPGVDAVIVKGGPMANIYRAGDEMTSGKGFHAPINGNRPYGLSHISFCSDGVDAQKPASKPGPCEPGGPTTMPDGKPCEAPKPCEPGGPTTMPDGKPCDAPEPCEPGGPTTMPDGKPCEAPKPCEPGGPTTMPDGKPCEAPAPCTAGGPTTMPDGTPCEAAAPTHEQASNPEGEVLGAVVGGGRPLARAQMSAPGSCVDSSFAQVVRGKGIRRVTMFVNGKRIRTFRGGRTRYAVTLNPKNYPSGVMRLKARVEFVEKSRKRPQTFRMTVLRCAQAAVQQAPAFAG